MSGRRDEADATRCQLTRTTQPLPEAERAKLMAELGFGRLYPDHIASATWTAEDGWYDSGIEEELFVESLVELVRGRPGLDATTRVNAAWVSDNHTWSPKST